MIIFPGLISVSTRIKIAFFLVGVFVILFLINYFTIPTEVKTLGTPFSVNQCISYKLSYRGEAETLNKEVCYENLSDGGFVEKVTSQGSPTIQATHDRNGITNMTEKDLAANSNAYPNVFKIGGIDGEMLKRTQANMKLHSIYFGPSNPKLGTLFNKNPITRYTEFNGKKVYEVVQDPQIDTDIISRGKISQAYWKFAYKYNLRFKKTPRTKTGNQIVEKLYYNADTGLLEGSERFTLIRDYQHNTLNPNTEPDLRAVLNQYD